jgi:hypothetical protein
MSAKTIEQLKVKTVALKKRLAEKASTMDGAKVRDLKKRIRRTQRRRRKMATAAARVAAAAKKKAEPAAS